MEQQFGGIWTQKKLDILQDYLKAYSTALGKRFTRDLCSKRSKVENSLQINNLGRRRRRR